MGWMHVCLAPAPPTNHLSGSATKAASSLQIYALYMQIRLLPIHLLHIIQNPTLNLVLDKIPSTRCNLENSFIQGCGTEDINVVGTKYQPSSDSRLTLEHHLADPESRVCVRILKSAPAVKV
jgi:hypothetical protein